MSDNMHSVKPCDKYNDKTIRWIEKPDHYERIFTDEFITPSNGGISQNLKGVLSLSPGR